MTNTPANQQALVFENLTEHLTDEQLIMLLTERLSEQLTKIFTEHYPKRQGRGGGNNPVCYCIK